MNAPLIKCTPSDKIAEEDKPHNYLSITGRAHPFKPYYEFNLKETEEDSAEIGCWDQMINSDFISVDISSHNGVTLDRKTSRLDYNGYNNLHEIRIWVKDFSTQTKDSWIATFASRSKRAPRSLTHPERNRLRRFQPSVYFRFVRHSDDKAPWIWSHNESTN